MKENNLKVKENNTLLPFLIQSGYAKNKAKSLLKYENVWVNGCVSVQYNQALKVGDEVLITNARKVRPPFPILFEDRDLLVIFKKEKLLTSSPNNEEKNLFQMAKRYLKEKNAHEKLFLLHRLDKETSGIVVFCKNQKLTTLLQDDWNHLVKRRTYTAVVEGVLEDLSGKLVFYLQEQGQKNVIVTDKNHGKKAITNYHVLKQKNGYSLVEIEIETGRKNQIRASFSHIAHPIVGDKKYYSKENPIGRVALVANRLEFVHPITKKLYQFEVEVPKSFWRIVK